MKQTTMNFPEHTSGFYLVDANKRHVGRLAVEIANALRGKDRPEFVLNQDCGDFVVVINSSKIVFTGKKWDQKKYYSHSTQPGKLKVRLAKDVHKKDPTAVLFKAVAGMMPKNKLSQKQLTKLRIFPNEEHTLAAQKPIQANNLRKRG